MCAGVCIFACMVYARVSLYSWVYVCLCVSRYCVHVYIYVHVCLPAWYMCVPACAHVYILGCVGMCAEHMCMPFCMHGVHVCLCVCLLDNKKRQDPSPVVSGPSPPLLANVEPKLGMAGGTSGLCSMPPCGHSQLAAGALSAICLPYCTLSFWRPGLGGAQPGLPRFGQRTWPRVRSSLETNQVSRLNTEGPVVSNI